mgnify:CR=1 FL=1
MRMSKNVNAITIYNNGEIKTYRFKELRGYIAIKITKEVLGNVPAPPFQYKKKGIPVTFMEALSLYFESLQRPRPSEL